MIKLIAFDWNGTLLADTFASVKADNLCLKKLGVHKIITLAEFQRCFDIPIIKYWISLGMDKKFFKSHMFTIEHLFHDYYEPIADKCRTRAGSKQVLQWLKKNNIRSIIYSNHVQPKIIRQLERLKIKKYLTKVMARENRDASLLHNRSKEQKLSDYIKQNKFKAHEVISVGDTEEEIEVGKKYGCYTVAITGGYNNSARLKKHHPDFLIHNMKDLIPIIKKLNN